MKVEDVEAFRCNLRLAEAGDPDAQAYMGEWYMEMLDPEKAIPWFEKSASQGSLRGMTGLGLAHYSSKRDVNSENIERTADGLFLSAAEKGYAQAQYYLGTITYAFDDRHRFTWISRAAEQGYVPAINAVVDAYRNGTGCRQSDSKAIKWSRKLKELSDEI